LIAATRYRKTRFLLARSASLWPRGCLIRQASRPLGGRALDILIALVERPGEVVTHKELISTVWPDVTVEEANLRLSNGGPSEGDR